MRSFSRRKKIAGPVVLEPLENRQLLSADIVPGGNPGGIAWPSPIVLSTKLLKFGEPVFDSDVFTTQDIIYAGFVMTNIGDSVSNVNVKMTLFLDGVAKGSFDFDHPDDRPFTNGFTASGFGLGFVKLAAGTYDVSMQVDTENSVSESNESNNTFTRQITVIAGTKVTYGAPPKGAVAGQTLKPVRVHIAHPPGTSVIGQQVTLSVASGPGNLNGTLTAVADENGDAIFSDLSITQAGLYKIKAACGPLTVVSGAVKISPAGVSDLSFVQAPTNVAAGAKFSPAIQVRATDAFGNPVASKLIKLAINTGPNGAKIAGSIAVATNASGVATFPTAVLKTAGNYKLTASYQLGANPAVTEISGQFTVSPAAASKMVFTTLPTGATHGVNTMAVVSLFDLYGNLCANLSSGAISLALLTKPAGGTLVVTSPQNITSGVAAFADLVFNNAGKYKLKAQMGTKILKSTVFQVA